MAKLNDILSTAEIVTVLSAMEVAAETYETESNRTPLSDVRKTLVSRARKTRAVRGRIMNIASIA